MCRRRAPARMTVSSVAPVPRPAIMLRRRAPLVLLLLATALPVPGCTGASAADEPPPFQAVARDGTLELDNRSGRTVFYRALDPDLAARARWVPCTDAAQCDHLAPNAGAQLPLDEVDGHVPGARQVTVFWWFAVPDSLNPGAGPVADSVRSVTVAF